MPMRRLRQKWVLMEPKWNVKGTPNMAGKGIHIRINGTKVECKGP